MTVQPDRHSDQPASPVAAEQPHSQPCPPGDIEIHLDSTPDAVRIALGQLTEKLEAHPDACELRETAEIVAAEALNNIVEHAYEDRSGGQITVVVHCATGGLDIRFQDRGRAMPGLKLPEGTAQALDVALDELPEGGFGWLMIHSLVEDLRYARVGDANLLRFRLPKA